jgi:hypothetical protein
MRATLTQPSSRKPQIRFAGRRIRDLKAGKNVRIPDTVNKTAYLKKIHVEDRTCIPFNILGRTYKSQSNLPKIRAKFRRHGKNRYHQHREVTLYCVEARVIRCSFHHCKIGCNPHGSWPVGPKLRRHKDLLAIISQVKHSYITKATLMG